MIDQIWIVCLNRLIFRNRGLLSISKLSKKKNFLPKWESYKKYWKTTLFIRINNKYKRSSKQLIQLFYWIIVWKNLQNSKSKKYRIWLARFSIDNLLSNSISRICSEENAFFRALLNWLKLMKTSSSIFVH
jgi:hypothetical protein